MIFEHAVKANIKNNVRNNQLEVRNNQLELCNFLKFEKFQILVETISKNPMLPTIKFLCIIPGCTDFPTFESP